MRHFLLFLYVIFFNILIGQVSQDPVLLNINNEQIRLSEFNAIYNKNNNIETAEQKDKDAYLTLFVNYKLKVQEAQRLGYDTLASFQKELLGYQKQLAQPYLSDNQTQDSILKEAYGRLKQEIKASHILVRVASDASDVDTLKAYNKIMEIRKRIIRKNISFDRISKEIKQKNDASLIAESLGYFTAFQMVYPFETASYNTEVGQISDVIRTSFGFHIIQIEDKRPSQGELTAAHIMIKSNDKSTENQKIQAKQQIDEIYNKLKAGESFEKLAKDFSDDKNSAQKGGKLKPFTSGRMVKEFEQAAFSLKNDQDYSAPFLTPYGWHIVKRISKKTLKSFEDEKGFLEAKVKKDRRGMQSRIMLIEKLKKDYNFIENTNNKEELFQNISDEDFKNKFKSTALEKFDHLLFSLEEKQYTKQIHRFSQNDFLDFLKKNINRSNAPKNKTFLLEKLYQSFVQKSIIEFEESMLSYKYPEYKNLYKEYRDGILLFNLMDEKVWSKAVKDSVGIAQFYEQNKSTYIWPDRVDADIYSVSNKKTFKKVRKLVKKNVATEQILSKMNASNPLAVKHESGKYQENEHPAIASSSFTNQAITGVEQNDKYYVIKVKKVLLNEPQTLENARGIITSDYQNQLEKDWIESLRKKARITVDQEVFKLVK